MLSSTYSKLLEMYSLDECCCRGLTQVRGGNIIHAHIINNNVITYMWTGPILCLHVSLDAESAFDAVLFILDRSLCPFKVVGRFYILGIVT